MFLHIPDGSVKFKKWKGVKMKNGKERMRIVYLELEKSKFIEMMKHSARDFVEHMRKVKEQYATIKKRKRSCQRMTYLYKWISAKIMHAGP